ncbi:GGDEF domain-containing protein [Aliikangiella marina]|uniref:diguanylate cyclase n=1 Tax=Aliikangiella marina TaxID=1712262 RepID=A0A545TBZ4_9GAMM|nr:GGDEF domain-containing protein [Aliikangiella marina]TQV74724.1 GGDEF domain-containing protein [Aliikangiella marina]
MVIRVFIFALIFQVAGVPLPVLAEVTYEDFQSLPPLPDSYFDLKPEDRLVWLKHEAEKAPETATSYRLNRQRFYEFYWLQKDELARQVCSSTLPLREDFYYRENCIEIENPNYDDFLLKMLDLIHEAKQFGSPSIQATLLSDLAWRQSQNGDIAGTYQNYEAALAIAPSDDIVLLNTIMMDSATNYIVHGDSNYVNKGIELLAKVRQQSTDALENEVDPQTIEFLKDNIFLTHFNTGIAYALHLYDYSAAINSFESVYSEKNAYSISALSFAALAAAELSDYDLAKQLIEKIGDQKDNQPVIELYLNCYRQLAKRHWLNNQPLTSCLNLDPSTTVEVQLDVYKRLSQFQEPDIQFVGLKKLSELYLNKIEPQLKKRGAQAASSTELKRLQRESELKTIVLEQQTQLQQERENAHTNRQRFFAALFIVLLSFILLIRSQLRQKKQLAEQFEQMSTRDSLTKLGNRRLLEQQIDREIAFTNRAHKSNINHNLGIFIFDIDHFKAINDTYGHQVGDKVLKIFSDRINQTIRDSDLFVRWGGEEFVLVARLDSNQRANQIAERILQTINSSPFECGGEKSIKVTCTIGVAKYPFIETENKPPWTRLISLADAALYYGKQQHRNCWVVIDNHSVDSLAALETILKDKLQDSIDAGKVTISTSF